MLDRFLALLMLIGLSPVFLIIHILIIIDDGLPVMFTQKRVGKNYSFFNMYKFRTMKKNAPKNMATHLLKDPEQYVFSTGKVIRKLSLDELPNLLNILKGDMVFVGPRPALFNQEDLMQMRVEAGIDKLKPGLTGWAQINGRDDISMEQKVALEKEYMERKSFKFDVEIFFRTFASAFFNKENVAH